MLAQFDLFSRPPRSAGRMVLRPYQVDAVAGTLDKLSGERSTVCVLATGLGKTVILGDVVRQWPGRVLVLAHTIDLIEQTAARLHEQLGEPVGIERGDDRAAHERVVVGSVQTLKSDKRLARFVELRPFTLIVVDECHHATAKTYRKIIDAFPAAKVLGVTATPDRGDGLALKKVFGSVAYEKTISSGIADGYLVPVLIAPYRVVEVDLSKVKVSKGDFSVGETDAAMAEAAAPIARVAFEKAGERRAVVFCPGVATAHAVAEALNRLRPASARAIDGKTDKPLRRSILRDHKAGAFQYVVNCGVLTEGYDDREVSCIVMARPTKSRALYTQMLGRGLRILGGIDHLATAEERRAAIAASAKRDCLVIDITDNSDRHDVTQAIDILGGSMTEKERKAAKKLLASRPGMTADDALAKAREQIQAAQRRAGELAAQAQVTYRPAHGADPCKVLGIPAPGTGQPDLWKAKNFKPPTPWQTQELARMKIDVPPGLDSGTAQKLIQLEKGRRANGWCTYGQAKFLQRYGYDTKGIKYETASKLRVAIEANGWAPLPLAQSNAILQGHRPEIGSDG